MHIVSIVLTFVEGLPMETFITCRWIKQGYPMSPSLFMMVLEILSRGLKEEVEHSNLELYKSRGIMVESHLTFDD